MDFNRAETTTHILPAQLHCCRVEALVCVCAAVLQASGKPENRPSCFLLSYVSQPPAARAGIFASSLCCLLQIEDPAHCGLRSRINQYYVLLAIYTRSDKAGRHAVSGVSRCCRGRWVL